MIYGILLIVLGILAVPSLLLSKKPNAKELLDKITPYQGWIGVVFCIWGVWGIIQAILGLSVLSHFPIVWILWMLTSVVTASLGFILGYGMISQNLLAKNETAKEKGEQLLAKLVPLQGKLGIAAIVIGILCVVANIMY